MANDVGRPYGQPAGGPSDPSQSSLSRPDGAHQAQDRPPYWLEPITTPHSHGCLNCNHTITTTFPDDGLIAVGFGFAACLKDGLPVLEEPQLRYDDDGEPIDEELDYPTGADAEALAAADPEHDWQIQIEGPLSGRTYQRQGAKNWVLVSQNMGFA